MDAPTGDRLTMNIRDAKPRRLPAPPRGPTVTELKVDPKRLKQLTGESTRMRARAKHDGCWGSYDIVALDKPSLLAWLKSQGGDNPWAEDAVGILLGHGHLHAGSVPAPE